MTPAARDAILVSQRKLRLILKDKHQPPEPNWSCQQQKGAQRQVNTKQANIEAETGKEDKARRMQM